MGGAVASWLVRSTPDRVVRFRVLAGDIRAVYTAYFLSYKRPYCVVFLGKALYSHGASLHPGVEMGTGENAGETPG